MKKIIFTFLLILHTTTSHAEISNKEISDSLKCAGIFTSTQFIKQGELPNGDLAYKENSLAAAKVTRFGKPYQKTLMDNCYAFIFKLIPNGKEKVEETSKTIYGG